MHSYRFIISFLFVPTIFLSSVCPFLLPWSYLNNFNSISFCRVSNPFWFPEAPLCTQPWGPEAAHAPRLYHLQNQSGRKPCPHLVYPWRRITGSPGPCVSTRPLSGFPPALGSGLETLKGTQSQGEDSPLSWPPSEFWFSSPICLQARTFRVFRWCPRHWVGVSE